jgi:hypothetical protein
MTSFVEKVEPNAATNEKPLEPLFIASEVCETNPSPDEVLNVIPFNGEKKYITTEEDDRLLRKIDRQQVLLLLLHGSLIY